MIKTLVVFQISYRAMDVQTGLVCVGIVVVSAAAILFISTMGTRGKSFEEAIAEQRKLPDDLLLSMLINWMICVCVRARA